jgi:hypothetical protein
MSTRLKLGSFASVLVLGLFVTSAASLSSASDTTAHSQRKAKKPSQLPSVPSGPLGPVPQMPLDSIAPVPPQVRFERGQLTIVALNSTLGDVLEAVSEQTGAEIVFPTATERVVIHLGPGPAREVIAKLLNGSRFNFVLLGSPEDPTLLTRVVLVAKTNAEAANPIRQPVGHQPPAMAVGNHVGNVEPIQSQQMDPDAAGDPDFNASQGEEAVQQRIPEAASP